MRPIRLSVFVPTLEGGGAEKCMLALSTALRRYGIRVTLIVSKGEGPHTEFAKKNLELVDLGSRTMRGSIPGLINHLKQECPDVLISALDHANVASLVARLISGVNPRIITTTHTMVSFAVRSTVRPTTHGIPLLMRLLYSTADAVVAVSDAVADDLARLTGLKRSSIHVIHNPVDASAVTALAREPVQHPWFDPGQPPVVLSVGSLWPHKDHRTLLEAFRIVRGHVSARLAILGDGPLRADLSQRARRLGLEHDVLLPGFVPNPYSWMARSAVFVLPSKWEGLPTVLVEAMACGLTPVATDCPGGSAEVLGGGRFGYLTQVDNPPAMADVIIGALGRPLPTDALRARASEFSIDNAAQSYLNLALGGDAVTNSGCDLRAAE